MIAKLPGYLAAVLLLLGSANEALAQGVPADDELEALRRAAEAEAAAESPGIEGAAETTFKSGGLGLQALNPEISVTGDFIGTYTDSKDVEEDWDFNFRGLSLHFEAYLDPYSRFKAAVPVNENEAKIGEAYFTRFGVLPGVNLTLGKFRQQFGVVNRWHKHALDYVNFPLPVREVFGPGGLNQTGLSFDWSGSLGNASQELILQVTDGDNGRAFGGNEENRPSILAHYKSYWDLTPSTYMELGLTGMVGWNDTWDVGGVDEEDSLATGVYGADLTLLWEPTDRMRYRNIEWRMEFYYVDKDILAPDGSGRDTVRPWGAYTSLQTKVSRTVDLGIRLDYFQPDVKSYADASLFNYANTEDDAHRWLGSVYVTWSQSPFVKYRIEYNHEDGSDMGEEEHRVMFQVIFAAGPHKHERY